MRKKVFLLLLIMMLVFCGSTTAFASMTDISQNSTRLPVDNPYTKVSKQLQNMAVSNYDSSKTRITATSGVSSYSGGAFNVASGGHSKEFLVNIPNGSNEKEIDVTAVYPDYLYFDDTYWTVTVHATKAYASKGGEMTFGMRVTRPGLCINDGAVTDNNWANVYVTITVTNSQTGAAMPNGLYKSVFGVNDVDTYEVYRLYDTNIGHYYTPPKLLEMNPNRSYIRYGINDGSIDFSGKKSEDLMADLNISEQEAKYYQQFYWLIGDRSSYGLRYGTADGDKHYASTFNFLALLSHNVKYTTDNGGTISGITSERVMDGAHPSGSSVATKSAWKFVNWTTKNAVKLTNNTTIPAGGALTMAQIKDVVVEDDQEFKANHVPRPQIEIKKLSEKDYYQVEDTVTYRISVWNSRPTVDGIATKETNLVVSDTLPSDLKLVSVNVDYGNSTASSTPVVDLDTSNNSFNVTFPEFKNEKPTIIVKATPTENVQYSKKIFNTATMKGTDSEFPTGEDPSDDTVSIMEVAPKLAIDKEVSDTEFHVGDTVHYKVTAKNETPHSWANNVVISDADLSVGQNIVSGSVKSNLGTVTQDGNHFEVKIDELEQGQNAIIEFDVKLDKNTLKSKTLYNKATVSSTQTGPGPEAEVTADLLANVKYEWKGDHPDKAVPTGGTYTWGITYETSPKFTVGDKVKDTVNGQKGSWVFEGWDHDASFKLIEDTVIKGEWKFVKEYDVTTSIENGTITPTEKDIPEGSNRVVSYTPNPGYQLKSITVDGDKKDIGQYPASYSFENIQSNHDVKVVCELIPALNVVKTADKDIYNAGDTVTYTVTVSQTVQGAEARDVVLEDTMPEGVTLNKDSITGDVEVTLTEDHSYKLKIASLKDEPVVYTYTGVTEEQADNESLINVVKATGSNVPSSAEDDANVSSLTPKPEITKIVSNETPIYGEEITYFVTVKEPQDGIVVRNAVITDALPEGVEYVDGSITCNGNPAEAKVEDGKLIVTIPVLEDEVAISFAAKVTAVSGSVDNVAILSGDKIEDIQANAVINIVEPEPVLTKVVSEESGCIGDTVSYTIQASSDLTLVDAVIKDTVPEGLSLVADSVKCSDETAEVKVEGNNIEAKVASLHDAVTITYDVVLQTEGVHKNTATLEAYNFPKGPLSAEASIEVYPPQPIIEKSVEPETASPGDEVTYTIKAYTEKGTVYDAVITDQLPEGLEYVHSSITVDKEGADPSVEGNTLMVKIPKLNEAVTVTFKAKVTATTGNIDNVAVLSGGNIEEIQDNAPLGIGEPNPTITKKASVAEANIGDTVTYTVTVNSDIPLVDPIIKDIIPDGVSLVEKSVKCSDSSANIEVAKNEITVKAASLQDTITITYDVVVEKEGAHKNTVTLSASNFPKGPISAEAVVTAQDVKPVVTKTVDKQEGLIGDTVKYTITAKADKGVINNAVISDKMPEGVIIDKDSISVSGKEEVSLDDNSFVVKCQKLGTDPITITYTAKLAREGNQTNLVTLTGDNIKDPAEAEASVKVNAPEYSNNEKKDDTKTTTTTASKTSEKPDGTPGRAIYKTGDFLPYILGAVLIGIIVAIAVVLRRRNKNGGDGNTDV